MEVLVTIGIILVLVGIAVPAVRTVKQNSLQVKTSNEIVQLDTALLSFFNDTGSFPASGQILASLSNKYFEFDSSRITGSQYFDPMGKPYFYQAPGLISSKGYDLFSTGLLMAKNDKGTLGKIVQNLISSNTGIESNSTSGIDSHALDIVIGSPSGVDAKTIWGLSKPTYDILVKGALALLQSTDIGFNLVSKIMISNIPIIWDTEGILGGAWAAYDTQNHQIILDLGLQNGPSEALAAVLGHEATHLSDHLANADQYFDSVQEEYDAFYNAAKVWEELIADRNDTPLPVNEYNMGIVQEMLYVDVMIGSGEEFAKDIVRQLYYYLPENEEYGDAYTVPKNI
jgi:type II secretory pathway pseudopilin PulG